MAAVKTNPSKPKRVLRSPIPLAVDTSVASGAINPGELVYLTANHKLASLNTTGTSNANAANCVGVAIDQYPVVFTDGITGSPIPGNDPNLAQVQYLEDGDHLFNTTASDSYNPYDSVYLGADGRTISKTATGSAVGYVSPDQRQAGGLQTMPVSFPISGGSGVQIYVRITPALAK